jgi:hypothetical protein
MEDKLRPNTTIRRPWNGYKNQEELNEERSGIPLMAVVYSNCQSVLEKPNKGVQHGRFIVSDVEDFHMKNKTQNSQTSAKECIPFK